MTTDEWDSISILLDKGFKWREPFGEIAAATYLTLLEGHSAQDVLTAIREMVAAGQVFGPTPGEIAARITADPSLPSAEEAFTMIYGKGGVIRARLTPGGSYGSEAEMLGARDEVRVKRAWELHPMLGAFVESFGIRELSMLEVEDPEWGGARRKQLREAWERHCEVNAGRGVAALARGRRKGLRQFDPLVALGGRAMAGVGGELGSSADGGAL